jgi:tryptophan halogenase
VGKYFKKVCGDKVLNIDAEIQDVKIDELGNIASLTLNNGTEVIGDFFIDATGFKKILMNKLHGQWKSYKKYLPVDRAMPFLTKYKPSEIIKPVTTARALDNGWLWQIPLLHRKGCGYVYSSEYTSDSAAQSELENLLGEKIDPIRVINFESGRQEELWIKNCMSIGLAAAFAEPLEATSIHTTIVQLENFAEYCLSETIEDTSNPALAKLYNSQMAFMYDLLKDFLVLHYQGNRTDTNFWKYITAGNTLTDFTKEILELAKIRMLNSAMFPQIAGAAGWPLWSFILAGTGNLTQETVKKDLLLNRIPEFSSQEFTKFKFYMENKNFYLQDNNDQIRKRQRQI